ncbi:hypothetical protein JB92DRAFT_2915784 [Gautieria morchelliformis]|nr:hypothetical protein JB92DRAFT_2915784 [Gautieria morchelliformis]
MTAENLATTPKGGHRRSYVDMGKFVNAARSVVRALRNWPSQVGKQGNLSQLGGELILGPSNSCHFAHFMRHTEDHIDVPELFQKAGVAYP